MRAKRIILAGLLLVFILVGCGSSGGESRHVVSIETDNGAISYGMTQEETEKILGEGEQIRRGVLKTMSYGDLFLWYRDDTICFLETDTNGHTLFNGAKIGDTSESVMAKHQYKRKWDNKNAYDILFDSELTEVQANYTGESEFAYIITYYFEDDKLAKAAMYDKQYSRLGS